LQAKKKYRDVTTQKRKTKTKADDGRRGAEALVVKMTRVVDKSTHNSIDVEDIHKFVNYLTEIESKSGKKSSRGKLTVY